MSDVKNITFDDFGDGIDRREGILSRNAKRFYELDNYVVNQGRKIEARPPLLKYAGQIDTTNTQGCEWLNGQLVTIAKTGAFVTHTVSDITTLYFDPPEGSTDWVLLEMVTFNEQICALIQHTFPASTACPIRNHLHVWDDARPTYVLDPSCPPSWSPFYPTQPFGEGKHGAYKNYAPRLHVVGERLTMTTAGGDTALSGVALPRVWNQLSPSEILANGEMFYGIMDGSDPQVFTVPVPYDDLVTEQRYAAYVCEYLKADGTWAQFTEIVTPATAGDYGITSVTNRWDATKPDETLLTIKPLAVTPDGTPFRFRAIATPTVTVLSGLYLTADVIANQVNVIGGTAVGGTFTHEGKSYNIPSQKIPDISSQAQLVNVIVAVPRAPVSIPQITGADSVTSATNGQQRYWSRTIAQVSASGAKQIRVDKAAVYFDGLHSLSGYSAQDAYWLHGPSSGGVNTLTGVDTTGLAVNGTIQIAGAVFTILDIRTSSFTIPIPPAGILMLPGCMRLRLVSNTGLLYGTGANPTSPFYTWYDLTALGGYTYALDGRTTTSVGGTELHGDADCIYLTQLKIGKPIDVNGEKRKVITISSDVLAEVELPFTVANAAVVALRDPTYEYAADVGDTGNEWYATKEAVITLKQSGKDDALVLGTSTKDNSGQLPVAIAAMDNRMLVQYPSVLQSWAVGPSVGDFRHLATMGMGAGVNSRPKPVLLDGYAGLPTVNGPRLFAPTNNNKDYVDFIAVGDKLRGIALPDLVRAVWWPRLRCWITCGATGGTLYVLAVHKDAKVLAWSTWTVAGITAIDWLFVRDNVLAVQAGADLYYFAPDADGVVVPFVDTNGAYTFRGRWLYNDLGAPHRNKKLIRAEIVQTGKSTLSIYVNPKSLDPVTPPVFPDKIPGPTVSGVTVGMQRFPIMAMGPGIALEIESSDPTGHALDQVGFDYKLLNR